MDGTEGLRLARLQVGEHASKRLQQMRERPFGMLPVIGPAQSNGVYFQPSYALLPDGLHDSKEDSVATLACRVLLTTRYVLTGSDDRRLLLNPNSSYNRKFRTEFRSKNEMMMIDLTSRDSCPDRGNDEQQRDNATSHSSSNIRTSEYANVEDQHAFSASGSIATEFASNFVSSVK